MADRTLTLNQKLALLPVAVPDPVLDFLEDLNYPSPLQTETSQAAIDPEYLKNNSASLIEGLSNLRQGIGSYLDIEVQAAGREMAGAFLIKVVGTNGSRGLGVSTRIKEKTVLKVVFQNAEYNEEALRILLKS